MIYKDELIRLLKEEGPDTPIYKIFLDKLSDDSFLKYFDMKQSSYSFKNIGLDCCSGQYIDVSVSLNDIFLYMSENELMRFNNEQSEYFNSDDYNENPTFANFEYWANCGKITLSSKFIENIKKNREITSQMILFDIEHQKGELPHFITEYKHIDKPTHLFVDVDENGVYNSLNNESPVLEDNVYNHKVYYKFCNIPYEYYSKHIVQPCSLHFNYTLNRFISSLKESPEIENQIKAINKEGLMIPLVLKINKNGIITTLVNCNTRFITALYLHLPYIPAVLMFDGTKDISNWIEDYAQYNDYCYNYIKDNHNDLFNIIQG